MRAAIDKGLRPGNHTDFNVCPIDQMFVVWAAVNHISRGGEVIGPDRRVTPLKVDPMAIKEGRTIYKAT